MISRAANPVGTSESGTNSCNSANADAENPALAGATTNASLPGRRPDRRVADGVPAHPQYYCLVKLWLEPPLVIVSVLPEMLYVPAWLTVML